MAIKNTAMGGTDWVSEQLLYVDLNDTFDAALEQAGAFDVIGDVYVLKEDKHLCPKTDDTSNLGGSGLQWMDLWLDGTAYIDALYGAALSSCTGNISQRTNDSGYVTSTGANTSLNNLSYPTSINQSLIPNNTSKDLGTSTYGWRRLYLDGGSSDGIMSPNDDLYINSGIDIDMESADDFYINAAGDDLFLNSGDQTKIDSSSNILFYEDVIPSSDCNKDIGENSTRFNTMYADYFWEASCDVAELAWVHEPYTSGTIVELAPSTEEQKELRAKELEISKEKKKKNPAHHRKTPFHHHLGLKSSWKKACERSTKCPSVVSFVPANLLNSSINKDKAKDEGKMRPIVLSGSVPFVMVEGEFEEGDILVSAGGGNAMVDNDAPPNQWVGWALESGNDRRIEIWIK